MRGKVIAWDFDGVLNKNIVNGRLVWKTDFARDLGVSENDFSDYMFRSGRFDDVLIGQKDVRDLVAEWLAVSACQKTADQVLHYWFSKDALPDQTSLALLDRARAKGCFNVLATNNEARRTAYIENEMGLADRFDRVFAAGLMGCKKPDPRFFKIVQSELNAAASDILFIDDKAANVEAASVLGWRAFHFREGDYAGLSRVISEHGG